MIYRRYIAREIFAAMALVTFAFVGLFGFFDLITELRDVGDVGYQYQDALAYVFLSLPGRAYELLPICVLIGSVYALSQLAKNSEVTVFRASGLSTWQLFAVLMRVGFVFCLLTVLLGEVVAPPAERMAQKLKLQAMSAMTAREFRSGVWFKDGKSFVNVRDVEPGGGLIGIRIYEFDGAFRLLSIRQAERGRFLGPSLWHLENIHVTQFSDQGTKEAQIASDEWSSGLTPDLLSVLLVEPERMPVMTLYRYVNYLDDNRRKSDVYEIALWKKLVYPFANLVMLVLALPFAYLQDRRGAASIKVFVGIMLGIGFHTLNGLFGSLASIRGWPPIAGALAPSLLFLLGALAFLWRTEQR